MKSTFLAGELPEGFEKRHRLDVADGAADLDDTDVGTFGSFADAAFDIIRHVGDDLDGFAEVVAGAFGLDDALVGLPGRHVVIGGHIDPKEAFVVAEIEVDLAAVLEDVHLAVLVGVHRPGVDVEIGVDLDRGHVEAGIRQQAARARGGDPFAEP